MYWLFLIREIHPSRREVACAWRNSNSPCTPQEFLARASSRRRWCCCTSRPLSPTHCQEIDPGGYSKISTRWRSTCGWRDSNSPCSGRDPAISRAKRACGLQENRGLRAEMRDELLNLERFDTLYEAKVLVERWRHVYNRIRPHSSLGYRPPAPETKEPWPPGFAPLRPSSMVPGLS